MDEDKILKMAQGIVKFFPVWEQEASYCAVVNQDPDEETKFLVEAVARYIREHS